MLLPGKEFLWVENSLFYSAFVVLNSLKEGKRQLFHNLIQQSIIMYLEKIYDKLFSVFFCHIVFFNLKRNQHEILKRKVSGYLVGLNSLDLDKNQYAQINKVLLTTDEFEIANIDMDGFFLSHIGKIHDLPTIDQKNFLNRRRFKLTLVVYKGFLGVKKNFNQDILAFTRELFALYRLNKKKCPIPTILNIDFDNLEITLSYIVGSNLREALAQCGAVLRSRDVMNHPDFMHLTRIEKKHKRINEGKKYLSKVVSEQFINEIYLEMRKIHSHGILLKDIKYGNIIIEKDSQKPYFIDFELSRYYPKTLFIFFRQLVKIEIDELNFLFGNVRSP